MRRPAYARQFEKDVKRMRRRGKDLDKLKAVLSTLIAEDTLPERYRDHALLGTYRGRRECHIEPDWLLIYAISGDEIIFERTGRHSDLFD
jgi:mRNA interferase YafQ